MATIKEEVRVFTSREEFDEFKREKIASGELTEKDFEKIERVMNEQEKPKESKNSFELVLEMASELTDAICLCACIAAREPEMIERVTKTTKYKLVDFMSRELIDHVFAAKEQKAVELTVKNFLYKLLFEARDIAEKNIVERQTAKAKLERARSTTH